MRAVLIQFGEIEIDGRPYSHDVIVDRGDVSKRKKGPSKPQRAAFGHTPLTAAERIPWGPAGSRLIVGTGDDGALPIAPDLRAEARSRGVELAALPTREACRLLAELPDDEIRAVLHVTC